MAISKKITEMMQKSSWIRRMFEEGVKLKMALGEENVFDFSLGNPEIEPPREFRDALLNAVSKPAPGMHRYMPNSGYAEARSLIAQDMSRMTGLFFEGKHIIMSAGAGGGMNVLLKSLLNEGDEVVIFAPYFVEYLFYIDNHGGKAAVAETDADFRIDIARLKKAVTPKTKVVIVNTPNNPTGAVYTDDEVAALGEFLAKCEKKFGHAIFLVSDEPYRRLIFDGLKNPSVMNFHDNAAVVYSHSKDLALPGERIGYIAISPRMADADLLSGACTFATRTLGFVNAPALMQRVCAPLQHVSIDPRHYERKRDYLYGELTGMGFKCIKPRGTFYIFPQCPIADDVEFVQMCLEEHVLVVPGSGFGRPGYFRIAYCVPDGVIEKSIPQFRTIAKKAGLKPGK